MRNDEGIERLCDQACECAGPGKKNSNARARRFVQKRECDCSDRARLFARVASHQKMDMRQRFAFARGYGAGRFEWLRQFRKRNGFVWQQWSRVSFAKMFLPRSDPGLIKIARFIARIFQKNGCAAGT